MRNVCGRCFRPCFSYYAAWRDEGILVQLNYDLIGLARVKDGRKPEPTASVIDTESVKTSTNVPLTSQGTDAAKKTVDRKRAILTDTIGLILAVTVSAASLSENALGIRLLDQAKKIYPTITKSWVDTGFKNAVVEHGARLRVDVEVVDRIPDTRGFHVVKRRWVAEQSLGWLMLHRRLARDCETLSTSSEAMIHIASIDNLAKRITDESTPTWRGTHWGIQGNTPRSNTLSDVRQSGSSPVPGEPSSRAHLVWWTSC